MELTDRPRADQPARHRDVRPDGKGAPGEAIPTLNDTSNEGAFTGALVQTTETDPTLAQVLLDAYHYTSKKILVSVELPQDSAINVAEVIERLLGDRLARITNRHFTVGTGSSQPNGLVTAATSSGITTRRRRPSRALADGP